MTFGKNDLSEFIIDTKQELVAMVAAYIPAETVAALSKRCDEEMQTLNPNGANDPQGRWLWAPDSKPINLFARVPAVATDPLAILDDANGLNAWLYILTRQTDAVAFSHDYGNLTLIRSYYNAIIDSKSDSGDITRISEFNRPNVNRHESKIAIDERLKREWDNLPQPLKLLQICETLLTLEISRKLDYIPERLLTGMLKYDDRKSCLLPALNSLLQQIEADQANLNTYQAFLPILERLYIVYAEKFSAVRAIPIDDVENNQHRTFANVHQALIRLRRFCTPVLVAAPVPPVVAPSRLPQEIEQPQDQPELANPHDVAEIDQEVAPVVALPAPVPAPATQTWSGYFGAMLPNTLKQLAPAPLKSLLATTIDYALHYPAAGAHLLMRQVVREATPVAVTESAPLQSAPQETVILRQEPEPTAEVIVIEQESSDDDIFDDDQTPLLAGAHAANTPIVNIGEEGISLDVLLSLDSIMRRYSNQADANTDLTFNLNPVNYPQQVMIGYYHFILTHPESEKTPITEPSLLQIDDTLKNGCSAIAAGLVMYERYEEATVILEKRLQLVNAEKPSTKRDLQIGSLQSALEKIIAKKDQVRTHVQELIAIINVPESVVNHRAVDSQQVKETLLSQDLEHDVKKQINHKSTKIMRLLQEFIVWLKNWTWTKPRAEPLTTFHLHQKQSRLNTPAMNRLIQAEERVSALLDSPRRVVAPGGG